MTTTTVAGVSPDSADQPSVAPEDRAELALAMTEPGPQGEPDDFTEPERCAAAADIATAICHNRSMLTRRERTILAAALLPEFEIADPA